MEKTSEILINKNALLKVVASANRVIAENGHRSVKAVL